MEKSYSIKKDEVQLKDMPIKKPATEDTLQDILNVLERIEKLLETIIIHQE